MVPDDVDLISLAYISAFLLIPKVMVLDFKSGLSESIFGLS